MTAEIQVATESVPEVVHRFVQVLSLSDVGALQQLRGCVAEDVALPRGRSGVDELLGDLGERVNRPYAAATWTYTIATDGNYVARCDFPPPGAMTPGGPIWGSDYHLGVIDDKITEFRYEPRHPEPADLAKPLAIGDKAPDFRLPDVSGEDVVLYSADSRATLVVFTTNSCPWALAWHERVQGVARDYSGRGLRTLQICSNDPTIAPKDELRFSRERVARGEFAGPYLIDEGQEVAKVWGAQRTPELFLLDRDHSVVYHGAPDADYEDESQNGAWIRAAVEELLSDRPVSVSETDLLGCTIKWSDSLKWAQGQL